jgi:hypothetical protein
MELITSSIDPGLAICEFIYHFMSQIRCLKNTCPAADKLIYHLTFFKYLGLDCSLRSQAHQESRGVVHAISTFLDHHVVNSRASTITDHLELSVPDFDWHQLLLVVTVILLKLIYRRKSGGFNWTTSVNSISLQSKTI